MNVNDHKKNFYMNEENKLISRDSFKHYRQTIKFLKNENCEFECNALVCVIDVSVGVLNRINILSQNVYSLM